MPEIHLKQSRFTYSASKNFNKNKIRMEKVREKQDLRFIYQKKLFKAFFNIIRFMGYLKIGRTAFDAHKCIT